VDAFDSSCTCVPSTATNHNKDAKVATRHIVESNLALWTAINRGDLKFNMHTMLLFFGLVVVAVAQGTLLLTATPQRQVLSLPSSATLDKGSLSLRPVHDKRSRSFSNPTYCACLSPLCRASLPHVCHSDGSDDGSGSGVTEVMRAGSKFSFQI
jgi:hypothetical protein